MTLFGTMGTKICVPVFLKKNVYRSNFLQTYSLQTNVILIFFSFESLKKLYIYHTFIKIFIYIIYTGIVCVAGCKRHTGKFCYPAWQLFCLEDNTLSYNNNQKANITVCMKWYGPYPYNVAARFGYLLVCNFFVSAFCISRIINLRLLAIVCDV